MAILSRKVLIPLPDRDFDTTEVAVPWRLLTDAGHKVAFATEHGGNTPACDPRLLTGVIFGQLGASAEAKAFYRELQRSDEFRHAISWLDVNVEQFDGLLLPGGHASGMRQYLESEQLQEKVRHFFKLDRPVGAICHGVLIAARAGAIAERRTTCLPKYMEQLAYYLTSWKLGTYYKTYSEYVEDEVRSRLKDPEKQFLRGPITLGRQGMADNNRGTFFVEDGNYVSARWTGDSYVFTRVFEKKLRELP